MGYGSNISQRLKQQSKLYPNQAELQRTMYKYILKRQDNNNMIVTI
jgi:hypothetical protein